MKKIVIVDDRPWKFQECIKELQKKNMNFWKTIYYPSNSLGQDTQDRMINEYKSSTEMEVVQVNDQMDFLESMDEAFEEPDTIFLMDYDLKGDMRREDFYTRINVKYAMHKGCERIWFYTSGPSDIKGMLIRTFSEHVISVTTNMEGHSFWDEKQVLAAVRAE